MAIDITGHMGESTSHVLLIGPVVKLPSNYLYL